MARSASRDRSARPWPSSSSTSRWTGRASNSSTTFWTSGSARRSLVARPRAGRGGRRRGASSAAGSAARSNRNGPAGRAARRAPLRSSPGLRASRTRRRPNCSPRASAMTSTLGGSNCRRLEPGCSGDAESGRPTCSIRSGQIADRRSRSSGVDGRRLVGGRTGGRRGSAASGAGSAWSAGAGSAQRAQLFFLRPGGPGPAPASSAASRAISSPSSAEIFQPGDPAQGQLDEQAAVRAAPQPAPGLGQDLQRGEDRVERPALGDRLRAGAAAAGVAASSGDVGTGRQRPSRRGGIRAAPSSRSAGWTPASDGLRRAAAAPRPGRGRPARRSGRAPARRWPMPSGLVDQLDGQPSGRRTRAVAPAATARRASSRPRGGRRPGAPRARPRPLRGGRSSARVATICSGAIPAKSYRWQRERTVIGILFGSVVAKKNLTCSGGSSSVFNRALKAPVESMWTSSM